MIAVRFVGSDGVVICADAEPGARLLDIAQACGQPLEGTCDGQLACATCHVVVGAEDFARLPRASAEEEDMLDLVPQAVRGSRLACQIVLDEELGSIGVRVPSAR